VQWAMECMNITYKRTVQFVQWAMECMNITYKRTVQFVQWAIECMHITYTENTAATKQRSHNREGHVTRTRKI